MLREWQAQPTARYLSYIRPPVLLLFFCMLHNLAPRAHDSSGGCSNASREKKADDKTDYSGNRNLDGRDGDLPL